ncbi:MAG: Hemolysin-type calcium-binding region [Solirubrobacterales bacterium]|nr:Hemolysin-type calcium-binding region [Solirubrobacterales bacterium]
MPGRGAVAGLAALAVSAVLSAAALGAGGDLQVSVDASPSGPVVVGQTMTFVVTVTNLSAETAENVRLDEVLPGNSSDPREPSDGHVQWVSQTPTSDPAFSCTGKPAPPDTPPYGTSCGLDRPLAGGESISLTVTGRADVAGHAVNYAYATSSHDAYDPATGTSGPVDDDPHQGNNTAKTAFEIVEAPPTVRRGDARGNTLAGGPGADDLFGRGGDDILKGLGGDDRLDGGSGDDVLIGGAGKDVFSGGPGRDALYAADGVKETVDCGSGKDTVTADATDRLRGCEIRHLRHR